MWKVLVLLSMLAAVQASAGWRPAVVDSSAARPVPSDIPSDRIVGGDVASPGQFPHQVGVWVYLDYSSNPAFCGGSILTKNVVVTAAHCAQPGQRFRLVFGAHEIHNETGPVVVRHSVKKLVHERYRDDGVYSNDIALLYFDEPLVFNERIQPIKLPTNERALYYNAKVTMSGWGLLSSSEREVAPVLHFVQSRVVTNLYCRARFFFQAVNPTNICVSGWWAKGTCQGDSGGPLVVYDAAGEPTLVGITSFGVSFGCQLSWPDVFTRVSSYLQWIPAGIASFKA